MGYSFNIENTWGTVTLNSNPTGVPGTPGCTVIDYPAKNAPVQDGTETVDEQFRILIQGTTQAQVDAIVGTIQRAFRTAEQYQNEGSGPRTFFTRSLGTMTTTYRSELVAADFGVASFEYVGTNIYGGGMGYKTELAGNITRRNWWEGAETQIPLTNPNGTANITGLRVYNDNCGTGAGTVRHWNYVDFLGTSVIGDLPAAYRMEIIEASSLGQWALEVCQEVSSEGTAQPGTVGWYEDNTAVSWSATALVNRTNGTAYTNTFSSASGVSAVAAQYDTTYFSEPGDYRVYACVSFDPPQDYKFELFASNSGQSVYSSDTYKSGTNSYGLVDIGIIHWPPEDFMSKYSTYYYFFTNIAIKPTSVTSGTIGLDFISVSKCDGYRKYKAVATSRSVYDDELDYIGNSSSGRIRLYPNMTHRLKFLASRPADDTNLKNIGWNIKLYYRPRYLSL